MNFTRTGRSRSTLSAAVQNCSWRGVCVTSRSGLERDRQPDDVPHCLCAIVNPAPGKGKTFDHNCTGVMPFCYNGCFGQGDCIDGVCRCFNGFWGLDCSSTRGQAGEITFSRAASAQAGPESHTHEFVRRPSFYIYDLPYRLSAWPTALFFWNQVTAPWIC